MPLSSHPPVRLEFLTRSELSISNGFVSLTLQLLRPSVSSIKANFEGSADFSSSPECLAAGGLRLETVTPDGTLRTSADADNNEAKLNVLSNTSEWVSVSLSGITDSTVSAAASEDWTFSLR